MATSRNHKGELDQEVCGKGYQVPINHVDAKLNQMFIVLGARNQLAHADPCRHPTHVQYNLRWRTATNHNSDNTVAVNGGINRYSGAHGYTLHV